MIKLPSLRTARFPQLTSYSLPAADDILTKLVVIITDGLQVFCLQSEYSFHLTLDVILILPPEVWTSKPC